MNLDNFTPGDAFLYDSWDRDDGHSHNKTGSNDEAMVLKKYEKAKTKQEVQHDKKLMNIPEIFEVLHSENDFFYITILNYLNIDANYI